ncbi:MAG TPA: rhodanese-like domain-containing protein [Casimicrobiaceae bacterium]|nr:rhodanese-like domain-containing protein [Casimicrobiaceae bacterium]
MLRRAFACALCVIVSTWTATTFAQAVGDLSGCPAPAGDATVASGAREGAAEKFTRPEESVPTNKRSACGLYLTATDAFAMVSENSAKVLFIDVRTPGELQFIGMPTIVDANVPVFLAASPPQWDAATSSLKLVPNADFVAEVDRRLAQKKLSRDATVVVICQGGIRAARAADALTKAGFTTVYTVIDGFEGDPVAEGPNKGQRLVNGWRNAGLPWTTKLERSKMYGLD